MFKKFFKVLPRVAAIACALLLTFSFVACDNDSNQHEHNFSNTLTQGQTQHWYECECGEKKDSEAHDYIDGVCKCGKADPNAHTTHDFSGAWVKDETQHWKKCSGCDATQDEGGHDYIDGVCKCGKPDPDAHTKHEYSDTWSKDESEHWHECACGNKTDNEKHTYTDGVCECGKPDPNAHTKHEYSDTWSKDESEHWHECACGDKTDNEKHTYIDGVCKCGKTDPNPTPEPEPQGGYTFPSSVNFGNDVSVHDPSIFKDPKDGTYYAFGSHFAVASSTDLIHWTQKASDRQYQKLYGSTSWTQVLSQGYSHANNNTNGRTCESTWAPDVEYYNNKYYMYVSLSTFGSNQSAIVRVQADSVLGPYSGETVIVKSSTGEAPNCIDPELFYDKEGKLWMVYGSFSGGIYIKELYNSGANWGLPKENGFGKLLWKGYSPPDAAEGGPEGPFIFRNGDYYYLIVSDGSLSTNYHMRVARSTSPDGPYKDITGADMASAHGKGNKLAGNWQFDGETGKAAYGHNSVCEIDGEFFVIAHMRYNNGSGGVTGEHNVRVHRILFNEQGWPVLASERYAGETLGSIPENEIAGSYDLILHSEGTSASFVNSTRYTFTTDHKITLSGAQRGTWSYKEAGNYIEITLDNVTYKGVAMPVWTSKGGAISLSAVSGSGRSLWANGVPKAQNPNLDIVKQVTGAANNTAVSAFNGDNGFTVSFYSTVTGTAAGADWNALALVCRGLQISLPNLRVLADNTAGLGTAQVDMYPGNPGQNVGSGVWNSYLGKTCFVTITISKTDGVKFYLNGECTQTYSTGIANVNSFVNAFLEGVKAEGFTFAESGLTASNLIVSRGAADAATAQAIYNYYSQN